MGGGADNFSATSSFNPMNITDNFSETSSFNQMGGADNFSATSSFNPMDITDNFSETSSFNQMGGGSDHANKINNLLSMLTTETEDGDTHVNKDYTDTTVDENISDNTEELENQLTNLLKQYGGK